MRKPAWMSKPPVDGIIECSACNHRCKISNNTTGKCGVRTNNNGTLELIVYGQASINNTDPIEKKPLYHFHPGSKVFSFGTVGCDFHCKFCKNWYTSQYHKKHDMAAVEKNGQKLLPEQAIQYCKDNNIPAIAFTYNEPAVFFEYAYDTAKLASENNIKTVYVTNGFETPEALEKISPYINAVSLDLKAFDNNFYEEICDGKLEPIKQNIQWLYKNRIWMEIITPIITNQNDTVNEITALTAFIASVSPNIPWHIQQYRPAYLMQDPTTPVHKLQKAYDIAKNMGLKYVYVSDSLIHGTMNTYCPKCQKPVIERQGFRTTNHLDGNSCKDCKTKIPGLF